MEPRRGAVLSAGFLRYVASPPRFCNEPDLYRMRGGSLDGLGRHKTIKSGQHNRPIILIFG